MFAARDSHDESAAVWLVRFGAAKVPAKQISGIKMTQPQSVSREPTMEEILASIRRIIEDSNAAKIEPEPVEASAQQSDFAAREPEFEEPASFAEVETLTADATPAGPALDLVIESEVANFEREFSEADVFARPVQEAIVSRDAQSISPVLVAAAAVEAEPYHVEPLREPFRDLKPIISDTAGRQVAKSFENLQVALHEERNTSVASMTEEMLRPMLQDWLDNNLPTLVERLVREEIERVSRGR